MIIAFVFVGAVSGIVAAGAGLIFLDLSVIGAALVYTAIGGLGFLISAVAWALCGRDQTETPTTGPERLDEAFSRV